MTTPAAPRFDIAIVGTVGVPARYGGFETLAEQLTRRLHASVRLLVCCTSVGQPTPRPASYLGAALHYVSWDANGWQSIPYDIASLWYSAPRSRAVLILGVSGCLMLPLIRLRAPHARIVTNIDGLEWKRRKWGAWARLVLRWSEWAAVRFSDVVIADNPAIQGHVQQRYGRPSTLIYYGGDHEPARGNETKSQTRFAAGGYFLGVCRIEPENNVREILAAFAAVPQAALAMVGDWRISPYAAALRREFGAMPNIELLDPIYDQERLGSLRQGARAYIHGHSAGGTNPSLVEAMTAGMPVLAFDVDYNRHTTDGAALYWCDSSALERLIRTVDDATLAENRAAMSHIAMCRYRWETVTEQYLQVLFPSTAVSCMQRANSLLD